MADWLPHAQIAPQAVAPTPEPAAGPAMADAEAAARLGTQGGPTPAPSARRIDQTCRECGKTHPQDNMIQLEGAWICAACKPVALQKLKEGVALPHTMQYAGFWIRFAAKWVDGIILLVVNLGVGFVLGPLVGGLLGELGTRAPFYAAAALSALNFVLGWFVMRETVTDRIRRPFSWRRGNPFGAFGQMARLPGIGSLMFVYFIYSVALYVYPAIWSYFTQERFGWTPQVIGLSLGLFGIAMALVQGGLIRVVLRRFGERKTVIWGQVADMGSFGLLAFVTSGTVALILTPIAALGAVVSPALQGLMSRMVGDDAQGELQGVLTSVHALSMIVSPLLMATVFSVFTRDGAPVYFPGAPFLVAMLLLGIGLVVFVRVRIPDA